MILYLSILVVAFNDPLYAATVMIPNPVTPAFGVLFIANFVVYLIFFWMVLLARIDKENGHKNTKQINKYKISICVVLYISLVVTYL